MNNLHLITCIITFSLHLFKQLKVLHETLHQFSDKLHLNHTGNPNGGLVGFWRKCRSCSFLLLLPRRSAAEEVEQLATTVKDLEVQAAFDEEEEVLKAEERLVFAKEEEDVPP